VGRAGTVFDRQSRLDPDTSGGWILTSVSGINDIGQIVGAGLHDGRTTAFVL